MAVNLSPPALSALKFFSPGGSGSRCPQQGGLPGSDETQDSITRRYMNSKVLGAVVPIAWTPDVGTVWVDGIPYTAREVDELMVRKVDAATMRAVHETKRAFDGTIN